ncbi:aminotransferase class I/II-fold pyridoxal phosphate-dependent enzyme [Bacillus fonticola]|uniref:aminotransferase class I/II-fold pyridoxal phosphate-dependent enzyme n=1 Tax=Bacillus fonticola TaxID=2728853 RepID=UPI0014759E89|nr:aminotransferase class I/II-fold pyridoxal phosphate-dependent enzyme [Bacillus fonticola]
MENRLNPTVHELKISGIRQFFQKVAQYENVLNCTIGLPDFHTPDHIKQATKQAVDENATTYTPNAGRLDLREAACAYGIQKYGYDYDPLTEVIVTVGASQALDVALRTVVSPGDEVLLPAPIYPGYEPLIRLAGGHPVFLDVKDTGFRLSAQSVQQAITEKTKALILPYPSNPTGTTMQEHDLKELADCLRGTDIFVIADEIYSELVYEYPHVSISSYLREQTLVINGLSKSHAMTGYRVGLLFGPASILQHCLKVHQYNVSCASSVSQRAALTALTVGVNDAFEMREVYKKRRDLCMNLLTQWSVEVAPPDGAFYLFIKTPSVDSTAFCNYLLETERVAVVPGDAFSSFGQGYIRLSYASHENVLMEALRRMKPYLTGEKVVPS